MEKKVFRSRISILLIGFILAIIIPTFIPVIHYRNYEGLGIAGGVLIFVVLIFTGMRYIISDGMLSVKMWFIPNGSVDIMNIVSVERTYNPLSSAAASLKRLYIYFNNRTLLPFWLISPDREQEFIEALKAINPNITVNVPERKGIWRIWDWDI